MRKFCAKVLCETFCAKVLCESFGQFFFEPHFESGAGCWVGLGGGVGLAGLGWKVGCVGWGGRAWGAGLGCGLDCWAGLPGLGWAGLCWAAGWMGKFVNSKMESLGWVGLGCGWAGLAGWAGS